jgi:hypothetical protein
MRNFLLTLALLAAAAAGAGWGFYHLSRNPSLEAAARNGDTMAWLRTEFGLDAAQFAAIDRLHQTYTETCARHCTAIMDARRRHASEEEIRSLEAACVRSMTDHFRQVAALMPPGQGERYLALVLPRIAEYDHRGAPTLRGTP